ncbi:DNRLRE domain-containing protein [Clostridium botulinum]|uniref:DNRLRE domain-containing protein n=1 Tax=Clostridium botulinum TaxID=1491 RepID=UPI0004D48CE5|nr:DNRLRE domain-containing protein [Clostridium botulinum]KEH99811.1 hypothetical protein Z952_p0140 [Clostridium botulinum C/D str. BKT75002]KEI05289.1 hypothetical protein Z954_0141 [Clostridium botulinum C/D str. BKT2873]QPW61980.1 DNRLRE domain-containing protein [Clostridium botulinum]
MKKTSFKNRMRGKIDVHWIKENNLSSKLCIPINNYTTSSLNIPYRNRMRGLYDITAPKREIKTLYPVEDTFVSEANPYMIFGSGNSILVGNNNSKQNIGLVKFDLSDFNLLTSIILLDCKLRLTISNVRDINNFKLEMKEVFNGSWSELTTTWLNQPYISNEVKSIIDFTKQSNETKDIVIEIDVKKQVEKWLKNPKQNQGVALNVNKLNEMVAFYSKEFSVKEKSPQLLIKYINLNSPFMHEIESIMNYLNVWQVDTNNMLSELEVVTKHSTNNIDASIIVLHNSGDCFAELEIVKDRLLCETYITSGYCTSNLEVFTQNSKMLNSRIQVKGENLTNTLEVYGSKDVQGSVGVSILNAIKSMLQINPNRLVNLIDIHSWQSIASQLEVNNKWKLLNKLGIAYGNHIDNILEVIQLDHISNEIKVLANKILMNEVFYGRFADLTGNVGVAPSSILSNFINVYYTNSLENELSTLSVNKITNELNSSIGKYIKAELGYTYSKELLNTLNISDGRIINTLTIQDVEYVLNSIQVQQRAIHGKLSYSTKNNINNTVVIPSISILNNELKCLNEKITNIIDVYVKETKYQRAYIHTLGCVPIKSLVKYTYESNIENDLNIYVDGISVNQCFLEVVNKRYEIYKNKGYGYIM